jgi:uncharacterized protein (TIGR02996 family)
MVRAKAHPEAEALYRAILAHPDEDTPRLMYVDWLQENGDSGRAELIRLQCRLARMNEWDDGYTADRLRSERLHREHWEDWVSPPGRPRWNERYSASGFQAVRGFPGGVNFTAAITPAEARRWFAPHPITQADVYISDGPDSRSSLWRITSDALPNLRALRLDAQYCRFPETRREACEAAAECRSGLTRLEVTGDPTPAGLEAVVTSPNLTRLEALCVRGEGVGDDHAELLAAKLNLPVLKELGFGYRGLTPQGARRLAKADWLPRLHALRLYGHDRLGDEGLRALLAQPLPELRTLHLHHCAEQKTGAIQARAKLPALAEVILDGDRHLHDADWLALTAGPQEFRSLEVGHLWLKSDSPAGLFDRPATRGLRRLNFDRVLLYEHPLVELLQSPLTQTLRILELSPPHEVDAGKLFAAGREWPRLERLALRGMPGESLLALIESDKFPRLVSLKAFCRDGWAKFLKGLAKSPAAAKFRELELGTTMTGPAARELADSPHLADIDRLAVHKGTATPADCERLVSRFGKRIRIEGYFG